MNSGLERFGLANARGRLYDPRIARFTTPDPIIADIFDGQSLNAFTYVWNNPLSFVDPSGFEPEQPPILPIITREVTHPDGSITVDLIYPPREGQPPKTLADVDSANATGAGASTADTGTTGASGNGQKYEEGFGSFIDGLFKGNLSDNDSWSATLGSVVGGLIPDVGIVADIRDLGAAISHIADGKDGAWLELGASIIGFVPGGDIAKGIAKGATKATTKAATKVGLELVDDAAKVLKGSTATAADGLTSAQKTAGKVNAPRGSHAKNQTIRGHQILRPRLEMPTNHNPNQLPTSRPAHCPTFPSPRHTQLPIPKMSTPLLVPRTTPLHCPVSSKPRHIAPRTVRQPLHVRVLTFRAVRHCFPSRRHLFRPMRIVSL